MSAKKSMNKAKKLDLIDVVLFTFPLLVGLQPLWTLFLLGIVCIMGIVVKVIRQKKLVLPKGKNLVLLSIYLGSFLIVSFYAIDKGMTVLAFFKNAVILLFLVLLKQYENEKEKINHYWNVISYSVATSVLLSLLFLLFGATDIFFQNRFHGLFYYANSYGLFLLVGMTIFINQEKMTLKDIVLTIILLIGIVLTNSRAIIIITFFSFSVTLFINKKNWKKELALLLGFVLIFTGSYLFSKLEKRMDGQMFQSGEFVTRLLYYTDALRMVKDNPLGYGYEGWYYEQARVQTGVYDSKYVHNSLLQVALDVGIIPLIALGVLLLSTFFSKKQTSLNRLLMVLILGHSLIDFDLEYIVFELVLLLMMEFEHFEMKKNSLIIVTCSALGILYFVLFLSDAAYALKKYQVAYTIFPFYTEALQEKLYSTTDTDEQMKLAERIYPLNRNVSGVYEALSNRAVVDHHYDEALTHEKARLALNKYTMMNYISYTSFLSDALTYYVESDNAEKVKEYANEIVNVEKIIQDVLDNTNPLCYKTVHPPCLEMPEEMQEFINHVKEKLE